MTEEEIRKVQWRQGGLLRCCMASLAEHLASCDEEPPIGTVLDCKFDQPGNGELIRAEDGVWEWNKRGMKPGRRARPERKQACSKPTATAASS